MPVNTREFLDVCDEQEIEFLPDLAEDLGYYRDSPTKLHSLLETIAERMRKAPFSVADKPLSPEPDWQSNLYATTLARMISARHLPLDEGTPNFNVGRGRRIDACSAAEFYFTEVFANIIRQASSTCRNFSYAGCEILTYDGKPLFVRKGRGEPSTINLRTIAINGIPYPPGSILRVDVESDNKKYPVVDSDTLRIIDSKQITMVAFRRLSMYAFDPESRHLESTYRVSPDGFVGEDEKKMTERNLASIEYAAQELILAA